MKTGLRVVSVLLLLVAADGLFHVKGPSGNTTGSRATMPHTSRQFALEAYGKLPLSFEVNQGQTDPQVRFVARGPGYTLLLKSTEAVLLPNHDRPGALQMQLVGSNPQPAISGLEQVPGASNYLRGSDPGKWLTKVRRYAKVRYANVYPGVDLVYHGNPRRLESDFVVAPGADPGVIHVAFEGADQLELDRQGDLVLHIAGGVVRLQQPVIYQEAGRARVKIEGKFVLRRDRI